MKRVSYIIETRKGHFKPFVAIVVPDIDDDSLYVEASGQRCESLEEAQTFLKENTQGIDETYLNPVKSSSMGITWLSELKEANKEIA